MQGYDVVLGADVCYSLKALPALFSVASQLLCKKPTSRFLLGYVSRAYSIDKQLLIEAEKAGLIMEEVVDTRADVGGSLQGLIYSIKHADCSKHAAI